jgi:polyhydroxybutyrate depolymerase
VPSYVCMRRRLLLLLFPCLTAIGLGRSTSVSHSAGLTDLKPIISIDGFERTYLVHLPPKIHSANKRPIVMMLHGRGGTSESAANEFGWTEKADQNGFIAVFPQALPFDPAQPAGIRLPDDLTEYWQVLTNDSMWWTDGSAEHYPYIANPKYPRVVHPRDAPFLAAVLHDVMERYAADPDRVFVVGFSSGAIMAAEMARATSPRIAGVGIVGSVGGPSRPHQLAHPISVFLSIGTEDDVGRPSQAQWDSMPAISKKEWFGQETLPTVDEDVDAWARLNHCNSRKLGMTPWGRQIEWVGCVNDTHVRGFSVDHLGHEWPGSKPSRWNEVHSDRPSLALTDLIWDFFQSRSSR